MYVYEHVYVNFMYLFTYTHKWIYTYRYLHMYLLICVCIYIHIYRRTKPLQPKLRLFWQSVHEDIHKKTAHMRATVVVNKLCCTEFLVCNGVLQYVAVCLRRQPCAPHCALQWFSTHCIAACHRVLQCVAVLLQCFVCVHKGSPIARNSNFWTENGLRLGKEELWVEDASNTYIFIYTEMYVYIDR